MSNLLTYGCMHKLEKYKEVESNGYNADDEHMQNAIKNIFISDQYILLYMH